MSDLESPKAPAEALRQLSEAIDRLMEGYRDVPKYPTNKKAEKRTAYRNVILELVTAYAATVEREGRLEELNDIPHIPIFLYSTRHDSQKLADAMEMSKIASLHVLKRRDELARLAALQGPQDDDGE